MEDWEWWSCWDIDGTLAWIPEVPLNGPRSAAVALGWSQRIQIKFNDLCERAVLNFQQQECKGGTLRQAARGVLQGGGQLLLHILWNMIWFICKRAWLAATAAVDGCSFHNIEHSHSVLVFALGGRRCRVQRPFFSSIGWERCILCRMRRLHTDCNGRKRSETVQTSIVLSWKHSIFLIKSWWSLNPHAISLSTLSTWKHKQMVSTSLSTSTCKNYLMQ